MLKRFVDKSGAIRKISHLEKFKREGLTCFKYGRPWGVGSLRVSIEQRALDRIGLVLRKKNGTAVKKNTISWPATFDDQRAEMDREIIEDCGDAKGTNGK